MLADKDRIFTNVYGFQPWNIDAAIMRGDWDNTKGLMALGQDALIDAVGESHRAGAGYAYFCVAAGVFVYDIHPCRSFPGDALAPR